MTADVETSLFVSDGGYSEKEVISYLYHSKNNTGTVKIDASKFTMSGVGYSVDTTMTIDFYENEILVDSYEDQIQTVIPPYSASVPYKAIGTDSIYFSLGFISFNPDATPISTTPIGYKVSWAGDTLILKTLYSETRPQIVNGYNGQLKIGFLQTVKLKK